MQDRMAYKRSIRSVMNRKGAREKERERIEKAKRQFLRGRRKEKEQKAFSLSFFLFLFSPERKYGERQWANSLIPISDRVRPFAYLR